MATYFSIPTANPLKPIWQNKKLPSDTGTVFYYNPNPSFNRKSIDTNFFYDTLTSFDEKLSYCAKYQQSDTIRVQWLGDDSTLANYQYARLLDVNGVEYPNNTVTVVKESGTYNSMTLYTITMHLYDVPEGKYFLQLRYKNNSAYVHCLFEPIHVKQIHPNTVRGDYYNSYNDQSLIYPSSAWIPQIRVEGCITEITPDAKFNNYEDQPLNVEFISGVPFRQFELVLGTGVRGIPEYMADKWNRITLTTDLKIDGKGFARSEGSKIEGKNANGLPLAMYTMKLREAENLGSLDVIAHATVSGGSTTFDTIVGDMPQTKYFYIQDMTIAGSTVQVRRVFDGKRNFLDYLNATQQVGSGHWYEDENNKLVYLHYATTLATAFSLTAANTLKYVIRIRNYGAGDLNMDFTKGAIGSTVYYAIFDNNTLTTAATAYTGTISTTKTYSAGSLWNDRYYCFSDVATFLDNASTGSTVRTIAGDIAPSMTAFTMNVALGLQRFENNIFNYVTALATFDIDNQNLSTYAVDDMLRWIYDSRSHFSGSANITLTQTPAAAPTRDLLQFKALIDAVTGTILTD